VVKSNHRITRATRAALVDPHGGVLSAPTTLLVLGSDQRGHEPARSDSILLMRFDPRTHTVSQLSIPRDTLVSLPGYGQTKINEAYFWGGAPLAIETVSRFTGVPINHVMLVNFHGFPDLIDSVGGVVVNVPHDLTSWYSGNITVHFKKGPQLMNGQRALIYSRVRHVDSDFMRMGRQQQVVQALEQKITRPRNLMQLPQTGARFMAGVGTDLSTNQIIELAYLEWRAKGAHQHKTVLLGTPEMIGGGSYVVVDPAVLARTVRQFLRQ
jgi:LCP family protein required for cell wall assembly